MITSTRSVVLVALLACSALAACGSSDATIPSRSGTGTDTQTAAISVFPDKVFVGIDENGKALAAAPIGLTGAKASVTWTSSSESVATASGGETSGKISAVKKGTSTITVKAGSKTATIDVTVNTYASADVTKGKTEFDAAKCAACHGTGPDITTSGVGKHTDEEILGAVVEGKNPEGGALEGAHKFTATSAMIAYVRSLPARTDTPIKDE